MERFVVTLILSALVVSQSLRPAPVFADEGPGLPIAAYLGEPRDAGSAEPAMSVAQWMAQRRRNKAPETTTPNQPAAPPTELNKITLPPYVIEPPDILAIEGIKLVPKAPQRLGVGDAVEIRVPGALPEFPINGQFAIDAGGYVGLGLAYGRYKLAGLTVEEAEAHLHEDLTRRFQLADADVVVSLSSTDDFQKITGQHLVAMDGRVNLGVYGSVYVTGMTISEARAAIEKHLAKDFREPTVSVDVLAYNSKVYYIITKGAGLGDDVVRAPCTGNETVLDAVANLGGISALGMERMWVARPAENGVGKEAILPVDWHAIARGTSAETNYQLFPGDRLYIEPKQRAAAATPPTALTETPYRLEKGVQGYAPEPRRKRVPILGPITSGAEVVVLDPPSDDEVLRAWEKSGSVLGIPVQRKGSGKAVRIVKEKIAEYVDETRDYPLIGAAQNHHAHYKCTIYDEGGREVIYVDHNHLHMAAKVDAGPDNRQGSAPTPANPPETPSADAPEAVRLAAHEGPSEAGDQAPDSVPTKSKRRVRISMPPPIAPHPLPPAPAPAVVEEPAPPAPAPPGTETRRVAPGEAPQVLFKIWLIRDRSGDVAELGGDLRAAGEHIGDSSTVLGALRVLEKHGLIEVYSRPEVIAYVRAPGRFALSHEMPREGEATQAEVKRWEVQITPRHIGCDEFGRTVFTEIEMTEGGDLHDGLLIREGKTLILATRQPHKTPGAGPMYLVVTPEIVE